jgi:XTP/dITP diphosphohydrolase
MKLILATENPGKVIEMRALLAELPLELVTPRGLGWQLAVAETGATYARNAYLKASAHAVRGRLPALADDSGLEVEALDGAPGLYSHRFLNLPNPSDADRRTYLVSLLREKPRPWTASFFCAVCVCLPNGRHWIFSGRCHGEIIPQERGSNGFGYDPVFQMAGMPQTMAELTDEVKNQLSHRALAVRQAEAVLRRLVVVYRS